MSQVNEVDDPGVRFSVEIFPGGFWKERKKKQKRKKGEARGK